jgi:hypothetical protein
VPDRLRVVGERPRAVHDRLRVVGERPRAVHDRLRGVVERPRVVPDRLRGVVERPCAVPDRLRVVGERPRAVHNRLRVVGKRPRVVVERPRIVDDRLRVLHDRPRVVHDQPRVVADQSRIVDDRLRVVDDRLRIVGDRSRIVDDRDPRQGILLRRIAPHQAMALAHREGAIESGIIRRTAKLLTTVIPDSERTSCRAPVERTDETGLDDDTHDIGHGHTMVVGEAPRAVVARDEERAGRRGRAERPGDGLGLSLVRPSLSSSRRALKCAIALRGLRPPEQRLDPDDA